MGAVIIWRTIVFLVLIGSDFSALSQLLINGDITDSNNHEPLEYVNIGIREKNIGTASLQDGTFSILIPRENMNDTLTFSLVGYYELDVPINSLDPEEHISIQMHEKTTVLKEVMIKAQKQTEKKYGIKRRNTLIHFTDGMFQKSDIFEIGQLIRLRDIPTQITSANLYINASRADSANFRINFYGYDDDQLRDRIIEKRIIQRHPVKEGWLRFELTEYNILLKGNFVVAIEFIPDIKKDLKPVYYEVKLGGTSKSFYRRNSLGQWNTPPHHYCLYVTALVAQSTPEEPEDTETIPALTLNSVIVNETFSIFIRLPKDYNGNTKQKYPVIYHLDGNAYFDHISHSVDLLHKKKKLPVDPIVVGIGYANAYVMDSLRDRDYTFPEALPLDSFLISGGGEKFYRFIKTELIPHIDKVYRTDTTNRTIMGHSLGGYFALYALSRGITDNALFNNYVAASPSISYHDRYIFKQLNDLSYDTKYKKKLKLYLTTGQMEIDEDPEDTFNHFRQFLWSKDFIYLKPKVYKKMEHMGTAVPSFEDGIEFILVD